MSTDYTKIFSWPLATPQRSKRYTKYSITGLSFYSCETKKTFKKLSFRFFFSLLFLLIGFKTVTANHLSKENYSLWQLKNNFHFIKTDRGRVYSFQPPIEEYADRAFLKLPVEKAYIIHDSRWHAWPKDSNNFFITSNGTGLPINLGFTNFRGRTSREGIDAADNGFLVVTYSDGFPNFQFSFLGVFANTHKVLDNKLKSLGRRTEQ